MRVPKVTNYKKQNDRVKHVNFQIPVILPRHPVITNERQRDKSIKRIERLCRQSLEYKDLIKFLRTNMKMDQCEFFPNIKTNGRKSSIEIHHAPFDLYTLAGIIMRKYEKEHDGLVNELMIAKDVMECHYQGLIGLIPLSITAHQLVHDGQLVVPLNCVYGRFVEFTQRYYEFIDDETMTMLNENIELTKNMKPEDLSILNTCYVYSHVEGVDLPEIEVIEGIVNIDETGLGLTA